MNEPIKYREYIITLEKRYWMYQHSEFTGAEDKRYGMASSLPEAKADIDERTIEEQDHQITILRKRISDLEIIKTP